MKTSPDWKTAPISPTCEVVVHGDDHCGLPTERAYPAMGGGWMALCAKHGAKHKDAPHIDTLIRSGERFT